MQSLNNKKKYALLFLFSCFSFFLFTSIAKADTNFYSTCLPPDIDGYTNCTGYLETNPLTFKISTDTSHNYWNITESGDFPYALNLYDITNTNLYSEPYLLGGTFTGGTGEPDGTYFIRVQIVGTSNYSDVFPIYIKDNKVYLNSNDIPTTTAGISTGNIEFGLAIIITMMFLGFIGYIWNRTTRKKPWK